MTAEIRDFDGWRLAIVACVAGMSLLLVAYFLRWPVPWWIYLIAFSACVWMPLWVALRERRV
jgi:hypothetical protein